VSSATNDGDAFLGLLKPGGRVRYLVVSEGGRPRFALPTTTSRVFGASMAAYRPTTTRALMAWRAARAMSRVGLGALLPGRRMLLQPRLGPFLEEIAHASGAYVSAAASFHGDRCVLGMIDGGGHLLGFAKVAPASNEPAVQRLRVEAQILHRLDGKLGSVRIPRVLHHGAHEGFEILVVTPLSGHPRFDASRLTGRRIDAAARIFSLRGPPTTIAEHLDFAAGDDGWDRRRDTVRTVTEPIAGVSLPSGLVHGDFAPWNLIDDGRRIGVIDWEYARSDGLPFWDLWHFAVLTAVSVGRDRMRRSILRAMLGEGRLAGALARYAETCRVPVGLAPDILLVYLVRQGAIVLEQARAGATDARRGLRAWARLLDACIAIRS
jgi:hypothetical protein